MHPRLTSFRSLSPDWNGTEKYDKAPIPSDWALGRSQQILDALAAVGVYPADEDIDPDAMGGVAVYVHDPKSPDKDSHFSVWNSGTASLVLCDHSTKDVQVFAVTDDAEAVQRALTYLRGSGV